MNLNEKVIYLTQQLLQLNNLLNNLEDGLYLKSLNDKEKLIATKHITKQAQTTLYELNEIAIDLVDEAF